MGVNFFFKGKENKFLKNRQFTHEALPGKSPWIIFFFCPSFSPQKSLPKFSALIPQIIQPLMRRLGYNQWIILSITLKSGDGEFLRTTHNTTAATLTTNTPTLRNSPCTDYDKREIPVSHMGCQGIFATDCKDRISVNNYEIISTSPAAGFHPFIRSHSDSPALAFIHETILWKSQCPQGRWGRE